MELTSFYVIILVTSAFLITYPQQTINTLVAVGLKLQIYYLNYRLKFMAWRMHGHLTRMCKESGFPAPGPFRFVDLWDRTR